MVEGYKHIFSNNAFHRDLKVLFLLLQPENLLIKDDSIKISDFGFVKIFSEMDMEKECRSGKNKMRT
jgi:serine/threonine protein kinase